MAIIERRTGDEHTPRDGNDVIRAGGGLVSRTTGRGELEVVVVHRPAYDDWTFPKGKLEEGETEAEAALREVEEETGLRCRLGRDMGGVSYRDPLGRDKTVRYWAMTAIGGRLAAAHEIDEARWVAVGDAGALLTYAHDRDLLSRLLDQIPGGRELSVPVYLVRHAKAGNRQAWQGSDRTRPLTEEGRGQAVQLVSLLGTGPLTRLLSSPFLRCMQTLEPLAQARRMTIDASEALAEGADPDGALNLLATAAQDGPAVLCTHGDVVVAVVERLLDRGVELKGRKPADYKKGSSWELEIQDGVFVSARYLPPPPRPRP
jgi:broad specificity phosphatase PhoE/8-oxo-dGTP pyrophosphatase MutT (NUDIX family)